MSTSNGQTVFSPWLTPVRLVSTSNVAGTYFNGPLNNGVGATLTIAASSLTVDSVVANVNDRILLQNQSAANTNGIYFVLSIGTTVVLQRSADQQSAEQYKTGEYVSVKAGSINAGGFFTIIEPLPAQLGVNSLVWSVHSAVGGVAFSGGPSTANALAVFSDTAGDIKAQTTTATLGFGLTASTGNIQALAGNLIAGSSGNAGILQSFPGTASKGSLEVVAVANTGNTATIISNAAMGQASTISIPDPGVSTSTFLLADNASGQTISTGNFTVAAGNIVATTGNLQAGSSGHAGTVASFPAVATEGELILAAVSNAGGNFNTTISNASSVGQSQVISIPDVGAATGNFILSGLTGAGTQHITSGALQVDAGAITSGLTSGGFVGLLKAFPTTASSGFIALQGAVNGSGNFGTTITNQTTQAQAQVLKIPDVGAATGNILAAGAALVSGNFVQASGTTGAVVDSGVSAVANAAIGTNTIGVPYTAIVTFTAAQINAMYTTPLQIVAAPGASQAIMVLNAQVITEVSTAFTSGGVAQIQYGNSNHAGGTIATSATIAAAEITAATSQIFTCAPIAAATVMATASFKGLGLFFTNATQVFATGTSSTVTVAVTYMVIPAV